MIVEVTLPAIEPGLMPEECPHAVAVVPGL
jgi:hypothetical protein